MSILSSIFKMTKYNGKYPLYADGVGGYNQSVNIKDPAVVKFSNATGIKDNKIITALDIFVKGLKTDGLWTKMYAIYPFVGGNLNTHKYNLVNAEDTNQAYRLVQGGSVQHTTNGIKNTGGGGFDTHIIPSSVITGNNVHQSFYSRDSVGGSRMMLADYWRNDGSGVGPGGGQRMTFTTTGITSGFFIFNRTPGKQKFIRNGSVLYDQPSAGFTELTTLTTLNGTGFYGNSIKILNFPTWSGSFGDGTTFNTRGDFTRSLVSITFDATALQGCFVSIGQGLTDTEALNLSTRVNTLQTELGRNVY